MTRTPLIEDWELSPRTQRFYDGHLRRFYAFLGDREVTEEGILDYLTHLDQRDLTRNYIRTCFKVLKSSLPVWPMSKQRQRRIRWRVDETEIHRPVLRLEGQRKMLAWARSVSDVEGEAFLAISTIYGARCGEIAQLSMDDVFESGRRLRIKTKKGGETRTHVVPDEIRPSLLKHTFHPVSERRASTVFRRMYLNSVEDRTPRTGWHAIRRALVTELIRAKLDFNVIGSFLRWKMSADVFDIPRMIAVYDQRPFEEIDRAALAVHPFLELWRQ